MFLSTGHLDDGLVGQGLQQVGPQLEGRASKVIKIILIKCNTPGMYGCEENSKLCEVKYGK